MTNKELISTIDEVYAWYEEQQLNGNYYLFQGEENEMNDETPWQRKQWLSIMRRRLGQGKELRPDRVAKIKRMHYFGPVTWPQERIKKRYEWLNKPEEVAA